MELTPEAFERACELMKATYTTDYHANGCFSLEFAVGNEQYTLTFGLPDNLAVLFLRPPTQIQFIFECNAITFHPKATRDFYMLFFHTAFDRMISPKLLVAGDSHGIFKLVQYSIPPSETEGELEFPTQL